MPDSTTIGSSATMIFGLCPPVPTGPVRRVERHARELFGFKATYGTRSGGVRLHRHQLAQALNES